MPFKISLDHFFCDDENTFDRTKNVKKKFDMDFAIYTELKLAD